jgi:hypothetical protein
MRIHSTLQWPAAGGGTSRSCPVPPHRHPPTSSSTPTDDRSEVRAALQTLLDEDDTADLIDADHQHATRSHARAGCTASRRSIGRQRDPMVGESDPGISLAYSSCTACGAPVSDCCSARSAQLISLWAIVRASPAQAPGMWLRCVYLSTRSANGSISTSTLCSTWLYVRANLSEAYSSPRCSGLA